MLLAKPFKAMEQAAELLRKGALQSDRYGSKADIATYWFRSRTFAAENDDEHINRAACEHEAAKQHSNGHRFFRQQPVETSRFCAMERMTSLHFL